MSQGSPSATGGTENGLRLATAGIDRVGRLISFTFAGEAISGLAGETIGSALTAAGRLHLGRRRNGAGRGLFCGMGACQECIVTIDGVPSQRACAIEIRAGMRIEPQGYAVDLSLTAPAIRERAAPRIVEPEVLVIGGGPAGLAAAGAAAECGAQVLLVDERSQLGGQYFKQIAKSHQASAPLALDPQFRRGRALIEELERTGVETWRNATVWGAFAPLELAVTAVEVQQVVRPKRLILATGAYERAVPFPGWTLPGCMLTGAGQTLQRAYRVAPGRRVLIAGNGPLNFQLACDLVAAGVEVVALAEAARRPGPADVRTLLRAAVASPDLMWDGARYLARLRQARVPVLYGTAIAFVEGADRVERAVVAALDGAGHLVPGTERAFAVDAVCTGYGLLPMNAIARALGCRHRFDATRGCLVAERDETGLSTAPGIFVVGDAGGMVGARASIEQGVIAGTQAALSLGHKAGANLLECVQQSNRRLVRHDRFQAALRQLFHAPILTHQLATKDTEICRCEGVSLAAIEASVRDQSHSLAAVKRHTRAGMGRCQGRYCGAVIAAMAAASGASAADADPFQAPRPPITPMPIMQLAEKPDR